MVDMYKQLLVGQDPTRKVEKEVKKKENWSEKFQVNPNMLEYGSKLAEITDFVVMDEKGRYTNTIDLSLIHILLLLQKQESEMSPGTAVTSTHSLVKR